MNSKMSMRAQMEARRVAKEKEKRQAQVDAATVHKETGGNHGEFFVLAWIKCVHTRRK